MRHIARRSRVLTEDSNTSPLPLFRGEVLGSSPAATVANLFADLRRLNRGQIIAEHPQRHLQGTRLPIDRAQGEGTWEFYRLDSDLFVVAGDGVYDTARFETVPGEGLVEFHLRVAGVLELNLPGEATPVTITGPQLLMLYQPPGVDISERVKPKVRDTGVSLFCRPQFLADLVARNGIARWPVLEEIHQQDPGSVWQRQLPLSPTLLHIGTSLLESPYQQGIRLLHAEAKALELLCEVLALHQESRDPHYLAATSSEARQLDTARSLLAHNLAEPLRIRDVARAVGMSESKLKRSFKARFGVTVFDYGLECRMRHALELLRCKRMSVGQVAFTVGYRHQTSFAAAFQEFFGFRPSRARTEMH